MRCLVTGGAGFIGSHLVDQLLEKGCEVIAVDNLCNGRVLNLKYANTFKNFSFYEKDIRNLSEIAPLFEQVDWVFHLAALADIVPSIEKPDDYYSTNVTGTFNVLQASKQANVKRFIYAASSSCYGLASQFPTPETAPISPEYPYALTKYLGEQLVLHWEKVYHLPALSMRFFNVYGPRSRTSGTYGAVFGVFLSQKIHQAPFTVVGDGTQTRDFTYVSDVAKALISGAESTESGEIFNIGSGNHYSINQLVELLGNNEVVYIPKRPGEPDCTFADISKIKCMLQWNPQVTFEEGVSKMLEQIDYWKEAPLWTPQTINEATKSWFKYLNTQPEAITR